MRALPLVLVIAGCASAPPRGAATTTAAYVDARRAEIAESAARVDADARAIKIAKRELGAIDSDPVRAGARRPVDTSEALVYTAGALQRERIIATDAERQAGAVVDHLHRVGHLTSEPGGFAIMIPAPRLWARDDDVALAGPYPELDAVAYAIARTAPESIVTIESRADTPSRGDAIDERVAQRRAEAVAAYLVSHGVARDHIQAFGLPPKHWDPSSAALHGAERRVDIKVTSPSPETP
jgi:hypothetical protein